MTDPRPVVGIAGLGYMGLATGLAFANRGWKAVGYDISTEIRAAVARGESPYSEVGLPELLRSEVGAGRFEVVASMDDLAARADAIFLCLPTPSSATGRIDLRAVRSGSRSLGRALGSVTARRLVVVKSTVVPGTTERVVEPIVRRATGRGPDRLAVASNPEFLAEGTMVRDALRPERVVVGAREAWAQALLRRLYRPFRTQVVVLTPSGAELVKYSSNTFLAMKVSFANEIARVAERLDVNVDDVMAAVGADSRIGRRFLVAGPGFGGSCFDKDVRALATFMGDLGVPRRLARATLRANDDRVGHVFDLVHAVEPRLAGRRVALLGLAFKAGTDDVRESRALPILERLLAEGAQVRAHDPVAVPRFQREWARRHPGATGARLRFVDSAPDALAGADLAILQADWPEYARWPAGWSRRMNAPVLVDLRRAVRPAVARSAGLRVLALGVGAPGGRPMPEVAG